MRTAPASTGKQPQPNRMQPPAPGSAWLVLLVSLVWALGGASRSGFTASVIFSGPVRGWGPARLFVHRCRPQLLSRSLSRGTLGTSSPEVAFLMPERS
jgi:hypothetical protein